MATKFIGNITIEKLMKSLAPVFTKKLRYLSLPSGLFNCIIFDTNTPITSGKLERKIKDFKNFKNLIVCANSFTKEAHEILKKYNGIGVEVVEFGWTDESYKEVKIISGTKAKRPDYIKRN